MSALAGNPAFIDALARRMGLNVEQMQALASQQTAGFTLSGSGSQVRINMAPTRACLGPLFVHTVDKQDVVVFTISFSCFFPGCPRSGSHRACWMAMTTWCPRILAPAWGKCLGELVPALLCPSYCVSTLSCSRVFDGLAGVRVLVRVRGWAPLAPSWRVAAWWARTARR